MIVALCVMFGCGVVIFALGAVVLIAELDAMGFVFMIMGGALIVAGVATNVPVEKEGTNQHTIIVADVCDSRDLLDNGNILVECDK